MSKYLVALDDGHGMETAGKRTPKFTDGTKSKETGESFMHENEFNKAVVKKLALKLDTCGIDSVLTAPTDKDTPLSERVLVANKNKADIFVSIHANAFQGVWGKAKGVGVFYYSDKGKTLANCVLNELVKGTEQNNRGIAKEDFYVIKHTTMPSILVEAAFMDNLNEANLLLSDKFRDEVATEVTKGICKYLEVEYKTIKITAPVTKPKPDKAETNKEPTLSVPKKTYIEIITDTLSTRKSPSWDDNAVAGSVKKGEVFTVSAIMTVKGHKMYQLKSGLYITASDKYVRTFQK